MWLAGRVLITLAAGALLAGCGGGDDGTTPATPEGYTERVVEADGITVSVSYPDEWGDLTEGSSGQATVFQPSDPGEGTFLQLRVLETDDSFEANSIAAASSTAVNSGFALEVGDSESAEVSGAAAAERISFEPSEVSGDTGTLEAVAAQTSDDEGTFVLLAVGGLPDVDVDAHGVLGSLQLDD